jgi:hypothetical protein
MKYPFFSENFFKVFLLSILIFNCLSAFGGGLGLILTNGLGMPIEYLGGFFSSFFMPGLILFLIVGGTSLAAVLAIIKKWRYAIEFAMIAGFGMQIWIYTEIYIIRQTDWLQALYFATGTLVLILSFLLFGRIQNKDKK